MENSKKDIKAIDSKEMISLAFRKIEELFHDYERRNNRVFSGFTGLGFLPGQLTVIEGYRATDFALNTARFVAGDDLHVAYISSKGHEEVSFRLLSSESFIHLRRLEEGHLEHHDWQQLSSAAGRLSGLPLSINFTRTSSISEALVLIERIQEKAPLRMVVVDDPSLIKGKNEFDVLQKLARSMDVPILITCKGVSQSDYEGMDCVYSLARTTEDSLNVEPLTYGADNNSILLVKESVMLSSLKVRNADEITVPLSYYPEIATYSHTELIIDDFDENPQESSEI